MVFPTDYVQRGLGAGSQMAALIWTMYGIGAMYRPGELWVPGRHVGVRLGIRLVLQVKAVALLL